jgi:hypothetical protein
MTSAILTSDRYIAIPFNGGVAHNRTLRILSKDGTATPCRWVAEHKRLESVAINRPGYVAPMFEKGERIERKLAEAGIAFRWLTLEEAQELTA